MYLHWAAQQTSAGAQLFSSSRNHRYAPCVKVASCNNHSLRAVIDLVPESASKGVTLRAGFVASRRWYWVFQLLPLISGAPLP